VVLGASGADFSAFSFATPESPLVNRQQRRELILPCGRLLLATGSLLAVSFDAQSPAAPAVALTYLSAAFVILGLTLSLKRPSLLLEACALGTDLAFGQLIGILGADARFLMLVVLCFAIAAAAYCWGFAEALATAATAAFLVWLQRPLEPWNASAPHSSSFLSQISTVASSSSSRAICVLFLGIVLAYLADRKRSLQPDTVAVGRNLVRAQHLSFKAKLQEFLSGTQKLVRARKILLAAHEVRDTNDFVWILTEPGDQERSVVRLRHLSPLERDQYFFDGPDSSWYVSLEDSEGSSGKLCCLTLDGDGRRLPDQYFSFPSAFFLRESCSNIIAIPFRIADEWSGRVFVVDSDIGTGPAADLALLQDLVWEAVPTLYYIYLLRHARWRAREEERVRVAHEIHDGLLQSLISVGIQIEVLRRRAMHASPELASDLERLDGTLRREVLETRAVMENLKLTEMSPNELLEAASDMVSSFQRETGIAASFVCEAQSLDLAPRACRQLASILLEALTNVRKHSRAQSVQVRFASEDNCWKLSVADDGVGFKSSDRLANPDSQSEGWSPAVIGERARSIGAELSVVSSPGCGSRVEVRLPQKESFGVDAPKHL